MELKRLVKEHLPFNEEEAGDQRSFIQFLDRFEEKEWATRENLIGHLTSSAWVVNKDRTKVLFAYHNIYDSWAWLGGHADGDLDLLHVAQKEAKEESGIQSVKPVFERIFDLSVQTVVPHVKKGVFVPGHLRFNATYLLEAEENEPLKHRPDENADVAWINMENLFDKVSEGFIKPTYQRIIDKIRLL